LPDFFRHNLLAAPRGQDGIGCGCDDSFRRDDTILGCFLPRQISKYVLAARDLNQLGHPADTTDRWLVPFLELDPWPQMVRRPRGYVGEASCIAPRKRLRLLAHADESAERADHSQDAGNIALVEGMHSNAGSNEIGNDRRLKVRKR
jgi:hypothetical protein